MTTLHTEPLSTEDKLLAWFKPDERELARHDDPEKTRLLSENLLARGQLQDAAAIEDGRLIFGHHRWLATKAAGLKTLRAKIYPASLTETEIKLIRAAENLHHKKLTGYRTWLLCADLLAMNPQWRQKDLAQALNVSDKMVTVNLSPSNCIQAWQEALKAGQVGISDCYAASKLPQDQQSELLRVKLSGASRDAIEKAGRKSRSHTSTTVTTKRVKIAMPQGASVVLSGNALGMAEVVDLLSETLKEARKNADLFDVKTWVKMMADKSRRNT